MDGLAGFAAQADEDVGGHIGVLGKAGQGAVELVVVGPVVLHGAAAFVRDGHHAIDIGKVFQHAAGAHSFGNILAGRGGAVDGTDDGDVIAGAESAIVSIVTHEGAFFRRRRRRRTIPAKSIVALECRGADVVHVNVLTGFDVPAGKADDLPVLGDRLPLLDGAQGDLVPQADALARCQARTVVLNFQPRLQIAGGDGNVIFRSQMDGHLR